MNGRTKTSEFRVTVVIPARNEEPTIGEIVTHAARHCEEVLVVDGHSHDRTAADAEEHGARVVKDNKRGKGDAIRVGAQNARYEIVVYMDADGSHDPGDIGKLVAPIRKGEYDMVIGSRGKGGSDELHGDIEKLLRLVGSDIILIGINMRYKASLTDSQNGFRAIRRDVMLALDTKEDITTIEQEMTMRALKLGYRVGEVPTHEYERKAGNSTIKLNRVWARYVYSWLKGMV
ncbi:MAG TPA: glycosyltransferase family 2 protein [Polyangiales bacterium]|jgi:dolichol-phosphate mannosyltransferase|nr:glycosyltransferase family 2 protein [Polyangiales bacterium]